MTSEEKSKILSELSKLMTIIENIEISDPNNKTIKGSPELSPGTITIQMNGIPDNDGVIENTLRKIVFETVNEILESRSDPDDVSSVKTAYETAQKYRSSEVPQ